MNTETCHYERMSRDELISEIIRLKKSNHTLRTQLWQMREDKPKRKLIAPQAVEMFKSGMTVKQIAKSLSCCNQSVYRAIKLAAEANKKAAG